MSLYREYDGYEPPESIIFFPKSQLDCHLAAVLHIKLKEKEKVKGNFGTSED